MKTAYFCSILFVFWVTGLLQARAQGNGLMQMADKATEIIGSLKTVEEGKPIEKSKRESLGNPGQSGNPSSNAARSRVLRLDFSHEKGFLVMDATTDAGTNNFRLKDEKGKLTRRLNTLNELLENYNQHTDEVLRSELKQLGALIYGAVKESIAQADEVAIGITPAMIPYPFEHLYFEGKPLCLQKPIVFYFDSLPAQHFSYGNIKSAQVIADLTADPDEACRKVATKFNNADYRDIAKVNPSFIKNLKPHDLLLVSAHGEISYDEDDCIEFNDESFYPQSWAKTVPQLAYFDSCGVGASYEFLKTFKKAGTLYFLAPITSNEAGNSSTKTIRYFFENLIHGESPERALFKAKIHLFEHYSEGSNLSYGKLLYRSMPFRAYRLN